MDLQGDIAILVGEDGLLRKLLFLKESLKVMLAWKVSLMDKLVILVDLRCNVNEVRLLHFQRDLEITKILVRSLELFLV